jgi:energy-coupling factor transporter ATP-binding protein EcfA2
MRLREFRVRGFKCIHDSGLVTVGEIAALVGKNESGKTALLEALTQLNKEAQIEELDLCDEMHEHLQEGSVVVEGLFEFSKSETASLRKAFPSVSPITKLRISRKYKKKSVAYDLEGIGFPTTFEFVAEKKPPFSQAVEALKTKIDSASELLVIDGNAFAPGSLEGARGILATLMNPEGLEKALAEKALQALTEELQVKLRITSFAPELKKIQETMGPLYRPVDIGAQVRQYIFENFHPKFVYFRNIKKSMGLSIFQRISQEQIARHRQVLIPVCPLTRR